MTILIHPFDISVFQRTSTPAQGEGFPYGSPFFTGEGNRGSELGTTPKSSEFWRLTVSIAAKAKPQLGAIGCFLFHIFGGGVRLNSPSGAYPFFPCTSCSHLESPSRRKYLSQILPQWGCDFLWRSPFRDNPMSVIM